MPLLVSPNHARSMLHRLKHHYGACGPEMVHYAAAIEREDDDAALVLLCERRLENVVRRAGLTKTRWDARRAVVRGHILVNGRKMTHPGYLVRLGDILTVRPWPQIKSFYQRALSAKNAAPRWLQVEPNNLRVTVSRLPTAGDVDMPPGLSAVVALLKNELD